MNKSDILRPSISAVVMTFNERVNIEKCLTSLASLDRVFVLDSASTDGTADIAGSFKNVEVVQMGWEGYAKTFNNGIDLAKAYDWVLRIDADEELVGDIGNVVVKLPSDVVGVILARHIHFLGGPLRYGPHSKLRMLRLFRPRSGQCEPTTADEHIVVNGRSVFSSEVQIIDRDNKPFDQWLIKHIRWAKKEARNLVEQATPHDGPSLDKYNRRKRFLKQNVYYVLPPFLRAFLYFGYRFFIRLECLGGANGMAWCFFQGLWYRLLVDLYVLYPELRKGDEKL